MDIGYVDKSVQLTLEGLQLKFLDDIMKLTKEQNDAEDAENSRHRERINAINTQYQEQLVALRARHANHRDEVLRRESHARKQQYEQVALDDYRHSNMSASSARGNVANSPAGERQVAYNSPAGERQVAYNSPAGERQVAYNSPAGERQVAYNSPAGERQAAYNADSYDAYRENARFLGNSGRDHGYEPRVQYPGGRVYDTAPRYY